MEAAVLLGLVAVGLLKNKDDNGDNPIIPDVNSDVKLTNGENLYESGIINNTCETCKTNLKQSTSYIYYWLRIQNEIIQNKWLNLVSNDIVASLKHERGYNSGDGGGEFRHFCICSL